LRIAQRQVRFSRELCDDSFWRKSSSRRRIGRLAADKGSRRTRVPGINGALSLLGGVAWEASNKASGEVPPTMRNFADATFDGALGGFKLENHAAGNDAALHQALDFSQVTAERTLSPSRTPATFREIDQLIGVEIFRAGGKPYGRR